MSNLTGDEIIHMTNNELDGWIKNNYPALTDDQVLAVASEMVETALKIEFGDGELLEELFVRIQTMAGMQAIQNRFDAIGKPEAPDVYKELRETIIISAASLLLHYAIAYVIKKWRSRG